MIKEELKIEEELKPKITADWFELIDDSNCSNDSEDDDNESEDESNEEGNDQDFDESTDDSGESSDTESDGDVDEGEQFDEANCDAGGQDSAPQEPETYEDGTPIEPTDHEAKMSDFFASMLEDRLEELVEEGKLDEVPKPPHEESELFKEIVRSRNKKKRF